MFPYTDLSHVVWECFSENKTPMKNVGHPLHYMKQADTAYIIQAVIIPLCVLITNTAKKQNQKPLLPVMKSWDDAQDIT